MAKGFMKYKEYWTTIEFDVEGQVLYGRIEGITDLVDFYSDSAKEIEKEFHDAVDSYLAFCNEVGKAPEKPYKGTFNVRISPDLHRRCAVKAAGEEKTLNQFVEEALNAHVRDEHGEQRITVLVKNEMAYEASRYFQRGGRAESGGLPASGFVGGHRQ